MTRSADHPTAIAVRAYAPPPTTARHRERAAATRRPPSAWTLVFDTETTTDAAQRLRFGTYQLYRGEHRHAAGAFYDPDALTAEEAARLHTYADDHGWQVWTVAAWRTHVLWQVAYARRARIVGFNLPFDISRIASGASPARDSMRGGFSLTVDTDRACPRIQVKSLGQQRALIRWTAPARQRTPKGERRRGLYVGVWRGAFVDVHTLAGAILGGRSWSLEVLSAHLGIAHPKQATDGHGSDLTGAYLQYAMGDVQATWECYRALQDRCARWGPETPIEQLYSEASLGKALLEKIGVRPWRDVQADLPDALIGHILSSYYGGRSEVRGRRTILEVVYADFTSMYPTVCTLMGLWRFVIAGGFDTEDATEWTRDFLATTHLADWQHPATWEALPVLVRIQPDDDVLPVRAAYDGRGARTIGLNHLTTRHPLWYTLADCVASTLLTGKAPTVIDAIRFRPRAPQEGLQPVMLMGNGAYRVDPYGDDLYRRLIELRQTLRATQPEEAQALKILANSTSYGIFLELNVEDEDRLTERTAYGPDDAGFSTWLHATETPGRYFHPLLGTLITGAARLMLALAELVTQDHGLTWAFCDTDSLALARPSGMDRATFQARCQAVTDWFQPLNPYATDVPLFKWEQANFTVADGHQVAPLYCYAISAKRYVLFNRDDRGRPVIRKASAHGLGHLRAPYADGTHIRGIPRPVPDLDVPQWQHDVWYRIVEAAVNGHPDQVRLEDLPGFTQPAMSRYAVTTVELWDWWTRWNRDKPYAERVKPFGFLSAFHGHPFGTHPDEYAERADLESAREERRAAREAWQQLSRRIGRAGGIRPTKDWPAEAIPQGVRRLHGMAPDVLATELGFADHQELMEAVRHRWVGYQQLKDHGSGRLPGSVHPIAPFDRDPATAAGQAFDRVTGDSVSVTQLKTYADVLAQYHLHPEAKFENGDYLDRGCTERRHIVADVVELIGKEANRWEEQVYLGENPEAQIVYGSSQDDTKRQRREVLEASKAYSYSQLARNTGLDRSTIMRVLTGRTKGSRETWERLRTVVLGQ